jgi:putative SOS response-associated peptidase YedK
VGSVRENSTVKNGKVAIFKISSARRKPIHRQGEKKRSLVIVRSADYDEWLGCKDPERARTYLQTYPAELMAGEPAPKVAVVKQTELF